MKVSLNWIKDYVDLPRDMDLTRLAYDLTMSTVEVEGASCRSAAPTSAAVTSGISSAAAPTSARA